MKKVFFTAALAMTTLFASAQFMVITTIQEAADDADGFEMEQVTDNIGFGYVLSDQLTVGLQKAGEDDYDLWVRYNFGDNMWATLQAPTEEASDNLSVGVGYSLNVWNALWVEPSYTMSLSDNSDDEGTLNLGLAYRF
jgi:hypothetical protein